MRGWKGACRNRLREELYHLLVSVRTGGGGTVEACAKLHQPLDRVNSPCTGSVEASNADNTAVGENSRKMRNSHCISQIPICEIHNRGASSSNGIASLNHSDGA
jgi:hypothetical protein